VTGKDKELLRTLGKLPRFKARTIDEPVFDGELFLMEAGPKDAPRVVMVHGLGDNGAFDWSSLFAGLAHHYRVLALDLPGFGRSTKANQLYSPDNYVKLVKWLAESQVEDRFNLIGHSMGGAISLLYAGTHGLDLQRLVLVDVAGVMHRHAFGEYMMRLGISNIPILDEVAGDAISWLAHNLARPFFRHEPDPSMVLKVAKVRQKLLKGDPEKIAALTLMFKNMGAAIDGVTRPPLVVWGEDDKIAPVRTGKLLVSRIPGGRLELLPRCGHVPMKEQPGRLLELVSAWLAAAPRKRVEPPELPPLSGPVERFNNQHNLKITGGQFERLELEGCDEARLVGVRAGKVVLRGCDVEMEHCILGEAEIALQATRTQLKVTGGSISGDVGAMINACDVDMAGVKLEGRLAAVRGEGEGGEVLFSVCPVSSPKHREHLHGIHAVNRNASV
jgi:pimeloyl-ACP methyl ester carboxylesterase